VGKANKLRRRKAGKLQRKDIHKEGYIFTVSRQNFEKDIFSTSSINDERNLEYGRQKHILYNQILCI
jgi:hypothetical protein